MQSCDVAIVGGGPAGSTCAGRLREAGLDVLIMDKAAFPRDKVCAGWVTPAVIDALDLDTDHYRRHNVYQPITAFHTGLIGGETIETRFDHPVSYGIRRCEFDHYLLQRCGARLALGEPVKSIRRGGRGWIINDRVTAPVLVGAGGHFCPVARWLGARREKRASVVLAQEVEFEASEPSLDRGKVRPETPALFFCPDLQGYGWCFRKGNYLNIGLGRTDANSLSAHVSEFREFLRESGRVCCEIPERFHGHAYQLYERVTPPMVEEGVLLIGDAAGLAYPQSGEGIRPAVESGLIAAEVVTDARGDYANGQLQPYAQRVRKRFGRPRGGSVTGWLPAHWLPTLAGPLMSSTWFTRQVLLKRWFLRTQHAPLESQAPSENGYHG